MQSSSYRLFVLLSIYILMLFRWGYEFGRNDQMQTLAYAKFIDNPEMYPEDFYIQGISENVPNERYIFSWMLSPFAGNLERLSLIAHIISSLIILGLLYSIASYFIELEVFRWAALLLLFIPFYGINLGGNELYYNTFQFSNLVKAIGLLGVYLLIRRSYIAAFSLFAIATFIQPVVGVQLYVSFSAVLFLGKLTNRISLAWKSFVILQLIYLFTAGIWVILLRSHFEADAAEVTPSFFQILFEFRSPHHYMPFSYPLRSYLILLPLFMLSAYYFRRREPHIYLFHLVSFAAWIIYIIGMEFLQITAFGALQWFKTSIWIKAFSFIALCALLEPVFHFMQSWFWRRLATFGLLGLSTACLILIIWFPQKIPMDIPFDFGDQYENDPAVDIAVKARELSPQDALFIHPILFTELKYYGERSSYVDFKPLVHTKVKMYEWHKRTKALYGIGYDLPYPKEDRFGYADSYYWNLGGEQLKALHDAGVTYMINWHSPEIDLPVVASNTDYRIYKLEFEEDSTIKN